MKKIAIIILNYNTWKETINEIDHCLEKLKINYKDLIVVDNASPNDSLKELGKESKKRKFVFLQSKENKGYAAGNNIGLRYAYKNNYDYALILNNDIIFDDTKIIENMLNIFSKDKKIAVVNPDIYSPNGRLYNRDSKRPTVMDYTLGAFLYRKKGRLIDDIGGYAYIYRPQGCCMMVDLKKLDEINYMDEHTFLYYEEPILAERLLKKGYYCALCTTSRIIHNHSTTVNSVFDRKKRSRIVNESFKYYLKEYRAFNKIQIDICLLFNCIKMLMV